VCSSALQCVAVCCNVLQCVDPLTAAQSAKGILQCVAVRCSVLQCADPLAAAQTAKDKNSQQSVCCYMYITKMNTALTFENFCQRTKWPLLQSRRVASRQVTTCTMKSDCSSDCLRKREKKTHTNWALPRRLVGDA